MNKQNKYFFHLIAFLMLSNCAFGQNYIDYHKRRMVAEQAILDTNYEKAVAIYDSLFTEYDFVFARNCYTACQTAIEANNMEKAFLFMKKGVLQGLKITMIDQDSILVNLKKDTRWENFAQQYDSLRRIYIGKVNWQLRYKIDELNDLDQKWRDKHELHPWNFLWRPFIWAKWKKVTKKIVLNKLTPLIDSLGFPGEKLIGIDESWMQCCKKKIDGTSASYSFVMLIHYFSIPREASLNEKLYPEIAKGNITPEDYASLIDFQAQWGKGKYYKGLYYNQWHTTKDSTLFPQIELNRAEIGLESLSSLKAKTDRGWKIIRQIPKGNVYHHIKLWHIVFY